MLIRFVVENFLSFKEETEFNLLTNRDASSTPHIYQTQDGISLLKKATLYGANGAGKSNLIFALAKLHDIVIEGTDSLKETIQPTPFKLAKTYQQKPTRFEIEFHTNNKNYAYSLTILNNIIQEEWLYEIGPDKEDILLFERITKEDRKTVIKLQESFGKTERERLRLEIYGEETRANQPFLTEAYHRDLQLFDEVYAWFDVCLHIAYPTCDTHSLIYTLAQHLRYKNDKKFKDVIAQILKTTDTGVLNIDLQEFSFEDFFGFGQRKRKEDILLELSKDKDAIIPFKGDDDISYGVFFNEKEKPTVVKLVTQHQTTDGKLIAFDLLEESEGTRKLLNFIPIILDIIYENKVYIIDEFNRSLHPHLVKQLVKLYNQLQIPTSKGQLIFTSHESYILDRAIFNEDEIWFAQKTALGDSKVYSLSDFKATDDLDIKVGYLNGRFGAIPFTGDIEKLIGK